MIKILAKNNILDYLKEYFKYIINNNEEVILYIINLLEVELDFFIYERNIIYNYENNNILLPFKPIIAIDNITINLNNEKVTNYTYEKKNNNIIIKSDVIENMLLNNLFIQPTYLIEYTCGYNIESIFECFPLIKKIIEDTYLFFIIYNKFEIKHKQYIDFLKKNISPL